MLGLFNEVHSDMLESLNGLDRLKVSLKSILKKVYIKVKCVNKKHSALENARIGPSVLSPLVPPYLHMQAL